MDSAAAFICWGNKILLFHRDDISSIPNPDCWSLPGGTLEDGEMPFQAVRRELREEITHVPSVIYYLGFYLGSSGDRRHVFVAYVDDAEAMCFKLGYGEGQEIRFVTLGETRRLKLVPRLHFLVENYSLALEGVVEKKIVPLAEQIGLTHLGKEVEG